VHPLVEGALFAGVLPALLSAGLLAGTLALSKSGTACTWRGGIAVALPFLVCTVLLMSGVGHAEPGSEWVPPFGPPRSGIDWIPLLGLLAAVHPRLLAWDARPHLALGLRLAAAILACSLLAWNKVRFAWTWPQAIYVIGALALAWLIFAQATQSLPRHARGQGPRGELPAVLGFSAAIGASAPIWGIAGSLSLAQASGALAAICAVVAGFTWLRPQAGIPRATLPAIAFLWGGIAVAGCLLTYELSAWVPLGFALVPLFGAQLDRPRLRRLPTWALSGLAVAACALPLGGVVAILSAPEPEVEAVDDDPYAGYESWTPSGE